MLARVDDDSIDQVFSDPVVKPSEVPGVGVLDPVGQLDLDPHYSAVRMLDYQIHFVVVVAGAQVSHPSLSSLGVGVDAERGKVLEQRTEDRAR